MNAPGGARLRAVSALRSRPFALLWSGQTISALGDGAYTPALAWQVLLLTHSSVAMAVIVTATVVPRLIFLLIGGLVADRLPRRLVLFVSDAGRAFVVGGIAVLGWTNSLLLWHLVALGVAFGVVGAFFLPAYRAMPPQLVAKDTLPSANALTEMSGQLGQLLGPLLGAALVALAGPAAAFGFDGLSFAISALSLLAIRRPGHSRPLPQLVRARAGAQCGSRGAAGAKESDTTPGRPGGIRQAGSELREAAGFIRRSTWLLTTIVVPAFGNAAFGGAMLIALPRLIHDSYGASVWLLGAVVTCVALGRISAALLVAQLRLRRRGMLAFGADVMASLALLAFSLPLPPDLRPVVALVAGGVFGLGGGTFQTIWVTLLHELVPNDILGRVASIDLLGSFCLQPLGFAAAGLVADDFGARWVFLGAGALNLVLYTLPLFLRGIRAVR
jgi:MFS family permease